MIKKIKAWRERQLKKHTRQDSTAPMITVSDAMPFGGGMLYRGGNADVRPLEEIINIDVDEDHGCDHGVPV